MLRGVAGPAALAHARVAAPIGPLPDLGPLNPLTYGAIAMAQRPFAPVVTRFRRDVLGLARSPREDAVPVLYAFSEHVVPRPSDWPAHVHVTGAWFLDDEPPPSDRLARFVTQGTPPVYVGFGSMARDPERTTRTVIEALRRADVRAVVATGWGGLDRSRLEEHGDVLVVDSAPHAWLFPRCAAIVHHGGAGTTAAALRAGRPSIVCPFFGDQHFWAARVHALGVGPKPIRYGALDAARLADAVRAALCDAEIQARAAEIGEAIRREHGTEAAARTIERAAA